jgi:hypothetical protein
MTCDDVRELFLEQKIISCCVDLLHILHGLQIISMHVSLSFVSKKRVLKEKKTRPGRGKPPSPTVNTWSRHSRCTQPIDGC